MKRTIIIISCLLIHSTAFYAQGTIDPILRAVEENNTMLKAMRTRVEADKLGNHTGLYPDNPEIELNYLLGRPDALGNRTDIRATQSFEFPTVYRYRSQISGIRDQQAELEYEEQRRNLLYETRLLLLDLVYLNAIESELAKRYSHALEIADAYQKRLDAGDCNILEYNKSRLNLLNAERERESIRTERDYLLSELAGLNGGIPLSFSDTVYTQSSLPIDFEQWYIGAEQANPALRWLDTETSLRLTGERLEKASKLPEIQAGYMSEKVAGEQFQGLTMGLSIPLWENRNKVSYAEANTRAIESVAADSRSQYHNDLSALYNKARTLEASLDQYRADLALLEHGILLRKALDLGEISLIEYMLELSIYYESVNAMLEMERDLNKAVAELKKYM